MSAWSGAYSTTLSRSSKDQEEWINTEIRFEITPRAGGATELNFEHAGLVPEFECYDICYKSWRFYVGHSLLNLVADGAGQPNDIADTAEDLGPRIDTALGAA